MNTHKSREIYVERFPFGRLAPGRLEIERIRFPSGSVSTEVRACIESGAQYAIYVRGDSPLGEALAKRSAVELLVDLEDAARDILRASINPHPADAIRLTCQHAVNRWEDAARYVRG